MSLRPNRRFVPPPRISLHVALVCLTLVCVVFGFASNKCLNRRKAFVILDQSQCDADAAISQGWERFDTILPTEIITTVNRIRVHGRDGFGSHAAGPINEDFPWAGGDAGLIDEDIPWAVCQFPEVKDLYVTYARLDPDECHALTKLPRLECLTFHGSSLPNDALSELANDRTLVEIGLGFTNANDTHCKALVRCSNLARVNLAATLVTDAGLRYVAELPKLSELYVSPDLITPAGIEHVLSRHPNMFLECRGPESFGDNWWTSVRQRYPRAKIQK